MFIYKYLKILYRLLAAIFEYKFTEMFLKIPLAPMGVLASGSAHAWPLLSPQSTPVEFCPCTCIFFNFFLGGGHQNYPKSYVFCDLKLRAKFQNPRTKFHQENRSLGLYHYSLARYLLCPQRNKYWIKQTTAFQYM